VDHLIVNAMLLTVIIFPWLFFLFSTHPPVVSMIPPDASFQPVSCRSHSRAQSRSLTPSKSALVKICRAAARSMPVPVGRRPAAGARRASEKIANFGTTH
jgi:hypothetical protein